MHDANGHEIIVGDLAKGETKKGKKVEGQIVAVSGTHPKVLLHDQRRWSQVWLHPSRVVVQLNDPDYQENENPVAQ